MKPGGIEVYNKVHQSRISQNVSLLSLYRCRMTQVAIAGSDFVLIGEGPANLSLPRERGISAKSVPAIYFWRKEKLDG